jgi:diaminopimelate epimerase
VTRRLLDRNRVVVQTHGGELVISWPEGAQVTMTGPAVTVFEGEIDFRA